MNDQATTVAGACPAVAAGNGLEETPRKFAAHVRKYILLYLMLLAELGDLETLHTALTALKAPQFAAYSDIQRYSDWTMCYA